MLLKNNVWRQFPGLGTASAIFAAYVVIDAIVPSFGGGHADHGHGDHGHGDHGGDHGVRTLSPPLSGDISPLRRRAAAQPDERSPPPFAAQEHKSAH